ncbi:MAG TPA: PAS domain S-box protein [Methanoregulaceae archaeon]|nr:PAS domain S-box protein [Methanoregulaceae archaeon]
MISALYVDDDTGLLEIGKFFLERNREISLDTSTSAREAMEKIRSHQYDAIISDYQMPETDGIEFLKMVRASGNSIPFIIFTGRGREEVVIEAINNGADFYLQKGGDPEAQFAELVHKIRKAVNNKRDQAALKRREIWFRSIVQNLNDQIMVVNREGIIIYLSPGIEKQLGYSQDYLREGNVWELIHPEDIDRVKFKLAQAYETDHLSSPVEYRVCKADGSYIHLSSTSSNLLDIPEIGGIVITTREITEQKIMEDSLRISQFKLMEAMDLARMADWEYDYQTDLFTFNDRFYALFGTTAAREGGYKIPPDRYFQEFVHPDDRIRIIEEVERKRNAFNPQSVSQLEHRIIRRDGETRYILVRSERTTENKGQIIKIHGVNQDITELRKALEAFQVGEEKYRVVVENSHEAIYIYRDKRFLFVNSCASEMTGYPHDELMNKEVWELVHPDDRARLQESGQRRISGQQFQNFFSARILTKTGEEREGEFSVGSITYQGQPAILGIVRDMTERKQAEKRIRESEIFNWEVINSIKEGIVIYDRELRITLWNRFMEELTGIPASDVVGKPAVALFPFHRDTDIAGLLEGALSGVTGTSDDFHFIIQQTGKSGWARGIYSPHYDATGDIIGVVGIVRGITEQRNLEELYKKSEQRNTAMIAAIPDLLFVLSSDGTCLDFQATNKNLLALPPDQIIGKNIRDVIFSADTIKVFFQAMSKAIDTGRPQQIEYDLSLPSGTYLFEARLVRLGSDRVLGIVRDITARKHDEKALRQANRQLNLMTSITRHDILNEITVILGYLTIGQKKFIDSELKDYFAKIESNAKLIKEQIDFTRIYQDLGTHAPQWLAIDEIISRLRTPDNVRLEVNIQDIEIRADPLLESVFFNLLDNSIRHGEKVTEIMVSSNHSDQGLTIVWEDNGIGVPLDEKKKIFEQGVGKNTGYGLFLAREILSITGITIAETSNPGMGARFEITVPKGEYRYTKLEKNTEGSRSTGSFIGC